MMRAVALTLVTSIALLAACSDDASTLDTGGGPATPPPDQGSSGSSGSSGGTTPEDICVAKINAYRATLGAAPLTRWTAAETCTSGQALSDSMSSTAHGAFGECGEHAQDECPGWPGPPATMIPKCLAQMWAEGPGQGTAHGHYNNMSNTSYTKVACGFATAADGSIWAVQNFE